MVHIVGICELGGYLGHLTKVLTVLESFAALGHRCTIIVPDLAAAPLIENCGFAVAYFVGPKLPMPAFTSSRDPANLSEVLLCVGMGTAEVLTPAARAWRHLLTSIQPDLVIYDYAPTAILASRGLKFKQVVIGSAFSLPPPVTPLPQFNSRIAIKPEHLLTAEQQLLRVWNGFLAQYQLPEIQWVADLFLQVDKSCLITVEEADGFAQWRKTESYLAIHQTLNKSKPAVWPDFPGRKIFGYLKTEYIHLDKLLIALRQGQFNCCIYISGSGAESMLQYSGDNLVISTAPLNMQDVVHQATWMIYHAGCGTATQALLNGLGSILIPTFYEQLLTANTLEKNQLGVVINPTWTAPQAVDVLQRALASETILANCQKVKQRYRAKRYGLPEFVGECLALFGADT